MDPDQAYSFEGELWRSSGAGASWVFITVPAEISHQIRFLQGKTKGFGSIRVRCRIGESCWNTSLFPDKASGCYFCRSRPMCARQKQFPPVTALSLTWRLDDQVQADRSGYGLVFKLHRQFRTAPAMHLVMGPDGDSAHPFRNNNP